MVELMSARETPSALALSWSSSIFICAASAKPCGRTCISAGFFAAMPSSWPLAAHECFMADAAHVLEPEVEAGGGAELGDRRRVHREDHGVLDAAEADQGALDHGLHLAVLARAFFPRLEPDEGERGILGAPGEAESGDGEVVFHFRLLGEILLHLQQRLAGALVGRADRQVEMSVRK